MSIVYPQDNVPLLGEKYADVSLAFLHKTVPKVQFLVLGLTYVLYIIDIQIIIFVMNFITW